MASASLRSSLSILPKRYASSSSLAHAAPAAPVARAVALEPLQVTKLENGLTVASIENGSPITRFAAVVNVGARDEERHEVGAAHAVRVFSGLATKNFSAFGVSRHLNQYGADFSVTSTREQTTYLMENTRDKTTKCLDIMGNVLSKPELRNWEIEGAHARFEFDLDVYAEKPELQIVDMIHRAAFRSGLSRSLFAPRANVHHLDGDLMQAFHARHFTADRVSLIGVGISHDDAIRAARFFRLPKAAASPYKREQAKYLGSEIRHDTNSDLVHVALGFEGVSCSSKDALAAAIASQAFGSVTGPRIKYSSGANKISSAVIPLAKNPALVRSFNANYSDAGLFGFQLLADKHDVGKLTKALAQEVSKVGKSGLSAEDITAAKNKLKAAYVFSEESTASKIANLGKDVNNIKYKSAAEFIAAVDAVSANDINAFVKRVSSGKQSLAAVGNLAELPYLDELQA